MPANENIKKFKEEIYNDDLESFDIECNDERLAYAMGRFFAMCIIACKEATPAPTKLLFSGDQTIGSYKENIMKTWKKRNYAMPLHVKWMDKLLAFVLENSIDREEDKFDVKGESALVYGLSDIQNQKTEKYLQMI